LFVSVVHVAPAFANAVGTSSGVTTSVGNPNDPSPEVQAQSSGFVQQNQQLQNAKEKGKEVSATAIGISTPNAANGAPNLADKDPANAGPNGKGPPPTAAAPPSPPPVYESTIRKLDRSNTAATANVSSVAAQKPEQSPAPSKAESKPAPPPAPAVAQAPAKPAVADASAAAHTATDAPAEHPAAAPEITGGRGEAPDGFTFYSGSAIAGMLLAFAFATYLKTGRNENAK
jgi:hypothetical protein